MNLRDLKNISSNLGNSGRMPLLFVGHGNPMNAITENRFSNSWKDIGRSLPTPQAILSVSAHWLTRGTTKVLAAERPRTIHDFGGFPAELYEQHYPAPGAPELARETQRLAIHHHLVLDDEWGFDHGTWSVLRRMFPNADIPVFQLSIDYSRPMSYHYELAKEISSLREKGVLILGSGNIVHNLQLINWKNDAPPFDWAVEFDTRIAQWIEQGDHQSIIDFQNLGTLSKISHPTFDHFLPLLYVLGAGHRTDTPRFFSSEFDMGSVSMRSVLLEA